MKERCVLFLSFVFIAVISLSAQTRTVTNEDLEKFRQKRLTAERDLRENYERLGFPSPEELKKQIEQSRAERSALSARLEAENLERQQLNLERQRITNEAQAVNNQAGTENYQSSGGGYFYNFAPFGYYGVSNYRLNRFDRFGFGFGRGYRRNYGGFPRYEYRNNLPVRVQPPPPRIFAPRQTNSGRHN